MPQARNDGRRAGGSFGPLPLVIGVTGHRDLQPADIAPLERRVAELFADLRRKYPSTPLVVLTALAEGADRLAARAALEAGARLVVPLPFARATYEQDFGPAGSPSRVEFATLLAAASDWFELATGDGPIERERRYAHVGDYVARHSHILLALWDGTDTDRVGGTATVVRRRLEGHAATPGEARGPLDATDSRSVCHLVTPRQSNPQPRGVPFSLHRYASWRDAVEQRDGGRSDAAVYDHLDGFNRDSVHLEPHLAAARAACAAALLPDADAARLSPSLGALRDAYATADALATHFQKKTLRMLRELFVLVFLATLSFTVYAHIKPGGMDLFWLYVTYLILIFASWLLWGVGYRGRFQSKHQDYRGLAEGLRVQFFWRVAGLPDLVEATYLGMQRGELEWIRKAIRVWSLPRGEPVRLAPADAIGLPKSHWVKDQLGFYTRAAEREHRHAQRYRRASRVLFGFFALQALFVGSLKFAPWHVDHVTREWLLVSMSVFVVASALVHNYGEKRAFSEHSKHYQRMAHIFDRAREVLGESGEVDVDTQRAILRELGREALTEKGDWVLLHRQRPIEVPEGEGLRGALPEALR